MKIIRMTSNSPDGYSVVEKEYADDAAWLEMIEQFNEFLASMGYIPRKYNQFVEEIENVA